MSSRLVLLLLAALAQRLAAQRPLVLRGADVVDIEAGLLLRNRTLVIDSGVIVALTAADSAAIVPAARVIDATGMTVLPGLHDLHAHPSNPHDLEVFLANGVTTIQALNAHDGVVRWSKDVARHEREGARVVPCLGPILDVTARATVTAWIDRARSLRVECLKPYDRIADSMYPVLIEDARRAGLRTVSHIPRNLTWEQALAARPSAIAHAEEFLYSPIGGPAAVDSIIELMRDGGIALVTTLTDYDVITRQLVGLEEMLRDPRLELLSPIFTRGWQLDRNGYRRNIPVARTGRMRALLAFQRTLVRRADSAGVRVLAGTDAGNSLVLPGSSLHDELEQLVLAGLSPLAALRSATVEAAAFLHDSAGGEVAVGRRADLLLVRGNPLTDITATRLIAGVVQQGRWFPRDTLRAMLDGIAAGYASERALVARLDADGVAAALAVVDLHHIPDAIDLNELGYQLWRQDADTAGARLVFEANARWHADDWLPWASLAGFREEAADMAGARAALARAAALAPDEPELADLRSRIAPP